MVTLTCRAYAIRPYQAGAWNVWRTTQAGGGFMCPAGRMQYAPTSSHLPSGRASTGTSPSSDFHERCPCRVLIHVDVSPLDVSPLAAQLDAETIRADPI